MRPELLCWAFASILLVDQQQLVITILPLVGLAIIVFCILSFFFPFGLRFKETTQTIHGFGVDLKISVLSLFLLIGTLMSCTGIFLYLTNQKKDVEDLNKTIVELKSDLKAAQVKAEESQHASLRVSLTLQGGHLPPFQNLECWYRVASNPDVWVQVPVTRGLGGPDTVGITLVDIGLHDVVQQLELREQGSQRVVATAVGTIYPLQPFVNLQQAQ
jgi:hypothetical protein